MTPRVLGIRHHGPGSARAVMAELDRLRPDAVLIEGPADADALIATVADPDLRPPVALLAYAADDPGTAAFWPFAEFSPEWQALRWSVRAGVPVHFCDLPAAQTLAHRATPQRDPAEPEPAEQTDLFDEPADESARIARADPIALLASAAGYDDPERWWDDVVETRGDSGGFDAITEAMGALRQEIGELGEDGHDLRREAHMRQILRKTLKLPGVERVAIVCGAWHAPALAGKLPPAAHDAKLLKGMPKLRTKLAWVPWTHSRLAGASGYGAGVISPGWYHHLFTTSDDVVVRWLIHQADLLREKDIDVSSAHIIETVRLAETLAVMRRRPLAGLAEISEATLAVMCQGDSGLADLMYREAVIGERLGEVPADAPVVPLQADLTASARSARLKQDPRAKEIDVDLRRPVDRAKSVLLHRLGIIGIPWGVARDVTGSGTFKEGWTLTWKPEFVVEVVMASVWGTTVTAAATARITDRAASGASLAEITGALEAALLADLAEALPAVLTALADRAAIDHDVEHLMAALPALGRARRYGDVRGTDVTALGTVASALLVRICAGLPAAVTGLGDDAAAELRTRLDAVHETVALLDPDDRTRWVIALTALAARHDVNGLLLGRVTRLLLDGGQIAATEAADRLTYALSGGATPIAKARWIEGFLGDGGLLLVHDRELLGILDNWLITLAERDFVDVLPLLRRTFGVFDPSVRRNIGDRVANLDGRAAPATPTTAFDRELAAPAVAVVADLLGLS
ncbi:hypothetical protein GYA93_14300 [Gordonia desulfuricans]|uniref:Uncharacterized protein n=1 Tax=Gordonia desulfuricans TaxID=89051 RepID=A0A7K3LR77_9ACTN|nr:DUF5682 family protein [Gordonia desulfuricans]NDK90743.1 hypothetical protein [Gordonia desulfuricans]